MTTTRISHGYNLLVKRMRAYVIKDWVLSHGYKGAVCYTSGNAGKYLKAILPNTIVVGKGGTFMPIGWHSVSYIANTFTGYFDATSGHLPPRLLRLCADSVKKALPKLPQKRIVVPTGSGETFIILKLLYPNALLIPQYNLGKSTAYNVNAPLNGLVLQFAKNGVLGLDNNQVV